METEKAKKTRRKETEKSGTKEGVKEKKAKANEEAMLEQRAKEEALKDQAMDFYRQLIERGFKPFDGASIDFHRKRDPVVFIPGENPVLSAVKKEELLDFLVKNNVRRVLIDAPFPSRAELLMEVSKAGMEVYFIRRPTIIEKFRKFLKKKLKIEAPKNDYADAVLQSFIKPKYLQWTDWRYLDCQLEMNLWRDNAINYQKYRQRLKTFPKKKRNRVAKLVTDIEENARIFVNTVLKHYPEVAELFKEFNVEDDVIAQAYTCEVFLEVLPCDALIGAINKAGIKLSEKASKKKLIHDGRMSNALNQLAINVYHLNPKRVDKIFKLMLVRKIWKFSRRIQMKKEGGRVGETLDRVGPESLDSGRPDLPKREGSSVLHPRFQGACESRSLGQFTRPRSKALNTRPTDNYRNHFLTHPLFPLSYLSIHRVYGLHTIKSSVVEVHPSEHGH